MPARARQAVFPRWSALFCMVSYEIIQVENFGADWIEKYFSVFFNKTLMQIAWEAINFDFLKS
jgi:hypothetical protein